MKKHAYLIIAHNEYGLLKKLLSNLDDERSDVYLHIDKKQKEVPFNELKAQITKSELFLIPRQNISWGVQPS